MKLPKISIVIPSYNKVDYVRETLQSVISQNYKNLELIVQDGGSTDGTLEIIREYANRYPEIVRLETNKDKGQAVAINKGFQKATGEILAFINADDLYATGAFKKVGKTFLANPDLIWLAGKGKVINNSGKEIYNFVALYKNLLLIINSYKLLLTVNYLVQPSVFLSKKAFDNFGPIEGNKRGVLEYDWWLRLGKKKMPKVLNSTLSSFRLVRGTTSSTFYKQMLDDDFKIAQKYSSSSIILFLHFLHNLVRTIIVSFVNL